jgi:hypothetical protein
MREYWRNIVLRDAEHDGVFASLKIIRLPDSWYAVVWSSEDLYQSMGQPLIGERLGRFRVPRDDDAEFLDHVRHVFTFVGGVPFDWSDPPPR